MALSSFNTHKILVLNEEKTRGIWVEFSPDMQTQELLDRIDEVRNALLAGLEAEKKKKEEAPKEEPQAPKVD
jgi:hypothetical protein